MTEEVTKTGPASSAKVWQPGKDAIEEGEALECDMSCYSMFHTSVPEWSCLSFDVVPDDRGDRRTEYPHIVDLVAGTQAVKPAEDRILMINWKGLKATKESKDDEEAEDSSDEEDEEENGPQKDKKMSYTQFLHDGVVNRIRCCPQFNFLVSSWSDKGVVNIWDTSANTETLLESEKNSSSESYKPPEKPVKFAFTGHEIEGYALDWNPHVAGKFLSGDCNGKLYLWLPVEGGWQVEAEKPFTGHTASVEDVHWKITGSDGLGEVFATASADQGVRIFDCRTSSRSPQLTKANAHDSDVNVLSWNPIIGEMLLTGDDSGCCKVWDIRYFDDQVVNLSWHRGPITSVGWNPFDEASFACSSLDNTVSIWDLSVEPDGGQDESGVVDVPDVPEQLMFVHMGQHEISELKWHPQIPGVLITTAADGFNIFKPYNI